MACQGFVQAACGMSRMQRGLILTYNLADACFAPTMPLGESGGMQAA